MTMLLKEFICKKKLPEFFEDRAIFNFKPIWYNDPSIGKTRLNFRKDSLFKESFQKIFVTKNLWTPKLPTNKIIYQNDLLKNIFDKNFDYRSSKIID